MNIKKPNLYGIVIINDDFTPRDFIVQMLEEEFNQTEDWSEAIYDDIKKIGQSIASIYPKDITLTKINLMNKWIKKEEFPLMLRAEEIIEIECK